MEEAKKAKKVQKNVDEIIAKIKVSSQKQSEEIKTILPKESGETLDKLKEDLKRAEKLEKSAYKQD
jgi:hypothetical protein